MKKRKKSKRKFKIKKLEKKKTNIACLTHYPHDSINTTSFPKKKKKKKQTNRKCNVFRALYKNAD